MPGSGLVSQVGFTTCASKEQSLFFFSVFFNTLLNMKVEARESEFNVVLSVIVSIGIKAKEMQLLFSTSQMQTPVTINVVDCNMKLRKNLC